MKILSIVLFSTLLMISDTLTFKSVVDIKDQTKDELYSKAKAWFVKTYKDANSVIQEDDKESGKIIGKGAIKYNPSALSGSDVIRGYINYTITVELKDNKYRCVVSDFYHDGNSDDFGTLTTSEECPNPRTMAKKWSNKTWKELKSVAETNGKSLMKSLEEHMTKVEETDDW